MARNWWLLIHLAGVFAFLTSHGVSVVALFMIRSERDRSRIREILQFSGKTILPMYVSLGVLVAAGVVLAVKYGYWRRQWLVTSVIVLVVTVLAMIFMARPYYQAIKEWVALRPSGVPRVSDEDLAARLTSARPIVVALIGFGGLLAILYLMIFKPV